MKIEALKRFRAKLARDEPVFGLWVTLESASITEMAVALGVDWVVVDAEHGHLDWKDINEHIRAGLRSETVVLVRIAERSTALTKRALDIGADGIVIPWMETADEVREAVRDAYYPPEGRRGIGGERATVWGQCLVEHTAEANENVLIVPLIESVAAGPNVAAMCEVDGVDIFFFGPADYSATGGFRGQWEGPGIAEQILEAKDTIRAAGKHCGLLATSIENLHERLEQGFRMPGLGSDAGLLCRSLHQSLQAINRDLKPATSLDPRDGTVIQASLSRPPAHIKPDRDAIIATLVDAASVELAAGVTFRPLAGGFNGARDLTTGVARLEPQAALPYHCHPCAESITVLEGDVEVAVEGRAYRFGPMDNIVIPRWLPHSTKNLSSDRDARLHNAFATSTPERELVSRDFPRTEMPTDTVGKPGAERVSRKTSMKTSSGPHGDAAMTAFFDEALVPGCALSVGTAHLQPGARLPARLLEHDAAICVIDGQIECLLEGQRDQLTGFSTAMVPRGRVHQIVNNSTESAGLIWASTGPVVGQIPVDDSWAMKSRDDS